jgi:anaerobic ribonucleoside-triphosphate reductase
MEIKSTLYKPFVGELNKIREKYGEEMLSLNGISKEQLNMSDFMDKLIDSYNTADASIDPNSNISSKDMDTIMNEVMKPQFKIKSLNRLYKDFVTKYGLEDANKWLECEISGQLYLHDGFEASFKSYCYNYSCERIAKEGMFFDQALKAEPAHHVNTFHQHILEFVRFATKRQSGAVGIGNFLIFSEYFFRKDKESGYLGITDWGSYQKQQFQTFVYALNQSGAKASQSAFTNVSIFDRNYLIELFGSISYPNNELVIDNIENIIQYQKDFLDWLKEERSKKLLTFPVLNASLLFKNGKFVDEDMARFCTDHIYLWKDLPIMCEEEVTSASSCCRLKSDLKTMGLLNSIVGGVGEVGSVKCGTLNLNRLALDSNCDKELFFEKLKEVATLNLKILDVQRDRISKNIEKGIMTLYSLGLMKLENQYQTFGIGSFGDMMESFDFLKTDEFGNQYYTEEGYVFGKKIFDTINKIIKLMDFKYLINFEQVPFEGGAITCVKKDRLIYGEKVKTNLYSNQWLSLEKKSTLQEKIKSASIFDRYCSGGAMLFVNVEGEFSNKEQVWKLVNDIAKQGVVTMNIVTNLNICENEHNYREKTNTCPYCGAKKIDETTKVVGFYTRKSNWQKERREEERFWFDFNGN